jgi:hypothetical protein
MLVPLETLSGWPQVPEPTTLQVLILLVGFPLLVFIIVVAINKIVQSIHAARGDDFHTSDPFWVRDHESAELEAAGANPGGAASDHVGEAGPATTGDGETEGDDAGEHVGGAGARW